MVDCKLFYRVALATAALLFTVAPGLRAQQGSDSRPNIILIVADDLGWKDLSVYGSTFNETPTLDSLAAQGVRFTDFYASCNVCSPSRSSIMTGQYPVHTGITDWITGRQNGGGPMPWDKLIAPPFTFNLDTADVTIGEALRQGGYATMYAGKWHLGLSAAYWPENQGFDVNKGGWAAGNPRAHGMGGYFSPYHNPKLPDGPTGEFLPDRLGTEVISFIEEKAREKKPFFVDLSFYAVHQPIEAKKEYIEKFKRKAHVMGLDTVEPFVKDAAWMENNRGWQERVIQSNAVYAALLYSVDENIGRIAATLRKLGIDRNTVILFTSDNGGLSTAEGAPTSNYPLRYGKGWNYEGGVRVPLIVSGSAVTAKGTLCRFPTVNTDLYPTLLQVAGLPLRPSQHMDGVSLLPLLKGGASIAQPAIYWHYPHYSNQGGTPGAAIREGDWKLVQYYDDGHAELYNLQYDIGERRDLSRAFPARTAAMVEQLNRWKKDSHASMPTLNPYYNPDYKELMGEGETMKQYLSGYHRLFTPDQYDSTLNKRLGAPLNRMTHPE